VLAAGTVHFFDRKRNVDVSEDLLSIAPLLGSGAVAVDWADAAEIEVDAADLEGVPVQAARYGEYPPIAAKKTSYTAWKKEFTDWVYRNRKIELLKSPTLKVFSRADESERDFRIRLGQSARESRDEALDKLKKKYGAKMASLQERIRRAEQAVAREAEQAKQQKFQTAISFGATLLSAMTGRKAASRSSMGRATTAARGVSRSMKESQDVDRARETVESHKQKLEALEADFLAETEKVKERFDPQSAELESVVVRPKKKDIAVRMVGLGWAPYWETAEGGSTPAWE
jgi:hypothetical protein